jgi:hypothetical protein
MLGNSKCESGHCFSMFLKRTPYTILGPDSIGSWLVLQETTKFLYEQLVNLPRRKRRYLQRVNQPSATFVHNKYHGTAPVFMDPNLFRRCCHKKSHLRAIAHQVQRTYSLCWKADVFPKWNYPLPYERCCSCVLHSQGHWRYSFQIVQSKLLPHSRFASALCPWHLPDLPSSAANCHGRGRGGARLSLLTHGCTSGFHWIPYEPLYLPSAELARQWKGW